MESNQLFSEQYRLCAKDWVEKDGAARMLKETKTAVLARMKSDLGDMPESKAEKIVKATDQWSDFIKTMVEAETAANLAKVKLKYIEMKYFEHQGANASARAEMRLTA